jgi:hypothetical protein
MFGMSHYVMRYLSMDFKTADECSKSVSHDGSIYWAFLDFEELHNMHYSIKRRVGFGLNNCRVEGVLSKIPEISRNHFACSREQVLIKSTTQRNDLPLSCRYCLVCVVSPEKHYMMRETAQRRARPSILLHFGTYRIGKSTDDQTVE